MSIKHRRMIEVAAVGGPQVPSYWVPVVTARDQESPLPKAILFRQWKENRPAYAVFLGIHPSPGNLDPTPGSKEGI